MTVRDGASSKSTSTGTEDELDLGYDLLLSLLLLLSPDAVSPMRGPADLTHRRDPSLLLSLLGETKFGWILCSSRIGLRFRNVSTGCGEWGGAALMKVSLVSSAGVRVGRHF